MVAESSMIDARLGEVGVGLGQPRPVLLGELARAQAVGVDPRVRAEHPERELGPRHLEREDSRRLPHPQGHVLGHVEAERCLAHRGPAGDDHEVAFLQAARHLVDVDEPGGQPGDDVLRLGELVDRPEALLDDLPHVDEALPDAALGDVEDRLLRPVEQLRRLVLALVAGLDDAVPGVDEVAEDRLLLDEAAPVLDAGDAGHAVHEPGQEGGPPHRLERAPAGELVLQGDEIDGLAPLGEHRHRLEDAPVGVPVEVLPVQDLRRRVEGGVVHEDRPEDGPLGLEVAGEGVLPSRRVGGHGTGPLSPPSSPAA